MWWTTSAGRALLTLGASWCLQSPGIDVKVRRFDILGGILRRPVLRVHAVEGISFVLKPGTVMTDRYVEKIDDSGKRKEAEIMEI